VYRRARGSYHMFTAGHPHPPWGLCVLERRGAALSSDPTSCREGVLSNGIDGLQRNLPGLRGSIRSRRTLLGQPAPA